VLTLNNPSSHGDLFYNADGSDPRLAVIAAEGFVIVVKGSVLFLVVHPGEQFLPKSPSLRIGRQWRYRESYSILWKR